MNRREFLKRSAVAGLYPFYTGCGQSQHWERDAYRRPAMSRVAILAAPAYKDPLKEIVTWGLKLFALSIKGKTVVLKPNLVEFDPQGVINTNPAVIAAALESFPSAGAKE